MTRCRIDLSGASAVVTGGSRGIGRATVRLLAEAGAEVVFGYRGDHRSAQTLLEQCQGLPGGVSALAGDAAQAECIDELVATAFRRAGKLDLAIGNAGIWKRAPITEMTDGQWQETIDVNLKSAFLLCRAAARVMKTTGGGRIILVSSTAGQRGEAFYSHYAASKAGLIGLVKSLAVEFSPWSIRINAVAPGWVDTDMVSGVMKDPVQKMAIEKATPLGRIANPEDIAGAILFLASDFARHIQGEILNVNGGSVLCG